MRGGARLEDAGSGGAAAGVEETGSDEEEKPGTRSHQAWPRG